MIFCITFPSLSFWAGRTPSINQNDISDLYFIKMGKPEMFYAILAIGLEIIAYSFVSFIIGVMILGLYVWLR